MIITGWNKYDSQIFIVFNIFWLLGIYLNANDSILFENIFYFFLIPHIFSLITSLLISFILFSKEGRGSYYRKEKMTVFGFWYSSFVGFFSIIVSFTILEFLVKYFS